MNATHVDQTLVQWQQKEETAEAMIPLIGLLYRKNDVITSIYGRQIINQSTIGLLKSHRFVKQVEGHELSVVDTSAILHLLLDMNLAACHIDIGKLAIKYKSLTADLNLVDFLKPELSELIDGYD